MSDLEKIKQLRQSTGAGFKDCSSAIKESKGDIEKASEVYTAFKKTIEKKKSEGQRNSPK
mgnify:CR=1 FL=1